MIDAVRYVVDNGIKWANMPTDFPPSRRVHAFVRRASVIVVGSSVPRCRRGRCLRSSSWASSRSRTQQLPVGSFPSQAEAGVRGRPGGF
ncbi:transposase [Streptomyces yatensis]|nr:transposase [Streptomyces yatensis]